jgi:hypothetical protein
MAAPLWVPMKNTSAPLPGPPDFGLSHPKPKPLQFCKLINDSINSLVKNGRAATNLVEMTHDATPIIWIADNQRA